MNEPFTPIPNELIDMMPDAVLVYAIISRSANHHRHQTAAELKIRKTWVSFTLEPGQAVISERTLEERTGIKRWTLKRIITDLESYGYMVTDQEDGCTRFTITAEASDAVIKAAKARKAEKQSPTAIPTAINPVNKPCSEEVPTAITNHYIDSIYNQEMDSQQVDKPTYHDAVINTGEPEPEFSTSDRATTEAEQPEERKLSIDELLEEEAGELSKLARLTVYSEARKAERERRVVDRQLIRELVRKQLGQG